MATNDALTNGIVLLVLIGSYVVYTRIRVSLLFAAVVTIVEFAQFLKVSTEISDPPLGLTLMSALCFGLWFAKIIKEVDQRVQEKVKESE